MEIHLLPEISTLAIPNLVQTVYAKGSELRKNLYILDRDSISFFSFLRKHKSLFFPQKITSKKNHDLEVFPDFYLQIN